MGRTRDQVVGVFDDKLLCHVCDGLLDQPVAVSCGHFFCGQCVQGPAKRPRNLSSCPVCEAELSYPCDCTVPAWVGIALDTVVIHCPQGCPKDVPLLHLSEHVGRECPNDMILCPNNFAGCRVNVTRSTIDGHLERCMYRRITCQACGQEVVNAELFKHQMKRKCHERAMKVELARTLRRCNSQVKEHNQTVKEDLQRTMQENRRIILSHWASMGVRGFERFTKDSEGRVPVSRASKKSAISLPLAETRPRCMQCSKPFSLQSNHETACTWHAGPIIETFGGLCLACGRPDHQTGCLLGYHSAPR